MATFSTVLTGIADGVGYKAPVMAATTVARDGALIGLLVIDGYQTQLNDRILVWQNATPSSNGIYVVNSGAWTLAPDWTNSSAVALGTQMFCAHGTLYGGTIFRLTGTDGIPGQPGTVIIGTTSLTFSNYGFSPAPSTFKGTVRNVASTTDTSTTTDYLVRFTISGTRTETLPSASAQSGLTLVIKDAAGSAGTSAITVKAISGQTIDGVSTFSIGTNYESITVIANGGSNWDIV